MNGRPTDSSKANRTAANTRVRFLKLPRGEFNNKRQSFQTFRDIQSGPPCRCPKSEDLCVNSEVFRIFASGSSASVLLVILRAVDYDGVFGRGGGGVSGEGVVPMSTDNASLSPARSLLRPPCLMRKWRGRQMGNNEPQCIPARGAAAAGLITRARSSFRLVCISHISWGQFEMGPIFAPISTVHGEGLAIFGDENCALRYRCRPLHENSVFM